MSSHAKKDSRLACFTILQAMISWVEPGYEARGLTHVTTSIHDLASFPGSSAWAEKKEPGTHCLRMLSFPRISGNLEISVMTAQLHQPSQGISTSPV